MEVKSYGKKKKSTLVEIKINRIFAPHLTSDEIRECWLPQSKKINMESLVNFVQDEFIEKKDFPEFAAGDTITAYYEIREGDKVRTQFLKGSLSKLKDRGFLKHLQSANFLELLGLNVFSPSTSLPCRKLK